MISLSWAWKIWNKSQKSYELRRSCDVTGKLVRQQKSDRFETFRDVIVKRAVAKWSRALTIGTLSYSNGPVCADLMDGEVLSVNPQSDKIH